MTHEPDVAPLLAEVLDLANQMVSERLSDDELAKRREQITAQRPKRRVNYNQDVTLCPHCKKRIRLNNNGRVRMHVKGKMGSEECPGSDANPAVKTTIAVFSDEQ